MGDTFNVSDYFSVNYVNNGDYKLCFKLNDITYHIGEFYLDPITGYYKVYSENFASKTFNDIARVMLNNFIEKLNLKLENDKKNIDDIVNIRNLL